MPPAYAWLAKVDPADALADRIPVPAGCERAPVEAGSCEDWLRHLPLKKGNPPVRLFNGQEKPNQNAHAAVVDIDVGDRDLQQCADAVIRLRAEYLFSKGDRKAIHFNFTSGDRADFGRWAEGWRPHVDGNQLTWEQSAGPDISYRSFRNYLNKVFTYAGTASLSKEIQPVNSVKAMRIGDVFIQSGSPGHAVVVVDLAADPKMGRKVFLLVQSYMPAQDVHILKNPSDPGLSPWYDLYFGDTLKTPEWTFKKEHLKRF